MASVNVTIRMDAKDKAQFEQILSDFGLTMNAAVNMFAKQVIREQAIPFKVARNVEKVQYLDRETLDKMLDDSMQRHQKVYKELAK